MTYMILDSTGSAINEYDDVVSAHAALRRVVQDDGAAADHVMLLTYDDHGHVVGDAIMFADLPVQTAVIAESAVVVATQTVASYASELSVRPAYAFSARRSDVAATRAG